MTSISSINLNTTAQAHMEPTSKLVEELSESLLTRGVNLAQLVAKTYLAVEEASQGKSHAKIDELDKLEKNLKTVTTFLNTIEAQLSNPNAKVVNMADHSDVVKEMHDLCNHQLFDKTSWTREEADTIRTAMTRHSQIIMQQVHHAASAVNRAIEEGTELLQINRKLLDMIHQLHQAFTSNQRAR